MTQLRFVMISCRFALHMHPVSKLELIHVGDFPACCNTRLSSGVPTIMRVTK